MTLIVSQLTRCKTQDLRRLAYYMGLPHELDRECLINWIVVAANPRMSVYNSIMSSSPLGGSSALALTG